MGLLQLDFLSEKLGYHTRLAVILPETVREGKEPEGTLYLLHGGGGNGQDWMRFTSVERYAQERDMAVVIPEVDGSCFYADMKYGYPYFTYLTEEVPLIAERLFLVNRNPQKRYVAGLSMGGYGAFKWAFGRPGFFAAAANLSGFSLVTELFGDKDGFAAPQMGKNGLFDLNWGGMEGLAGSSSDSAVWLDEAAGRRAELPRLFAAIGTEDFSYECGLHFIKACRERGIDIHYEEMAGAHEWRVWDVMLERFMDWCTGRRTGTAEVFCESGGK